MPDSKIVISKLSKQYGSDRFALKDLTLQVAGGEVYGFLGPNGAGKSTTIRLMMNFIQPTSGTATILGNDIVNDSVNIRRSVGYLSGDFEIYPKMTGRQFLQYLSELQGINATSRINKLAKALRADLKKPLGSLSRGNRQKIGIIQAFMHDPEILILDEPTSGLDPLMQEVFYSLVADAKKRGSAIFVSSHILSEVQKMCDRVGIIRDGLLIKEEVISRLVENMSHTFDIDFSRTVPLSELKKVTGLKVLAHNKTTVSINMNGKLADLFAVLAKYDVVRIDAKNLDLESLFMHFYKPEPKS